MSDVLLAIGPEGFGNYKIEWSPTGPHFTPTNQPATGLLAPGFVDIHVHGAFGMDFMSSSTEEIIVGLDKLAQKGYERLLPTSVTATTEDINDFLAKLPNHKLIAGVHLEGPFISPKYPGAQPPLAIASPPDPGSRWEPILKDPRVKVMTLAPELPGSLELITMLAKQGVRVGIGHTNSTFAEAKAGFDSGATHTTHTYNAMRPLHHREAGTVGFALLENRLATELIYDRVHVVREAADLLVRSKPSTKLIAVSDGTMASGLKAGTRLTMWNLEVIVGEGEVRLLDGTLAGSAITLLEAFQNLAADFGPEVAIRATSYNPRTLIGLDDDPTVWLEFAPDFTLRRRWERSMNQLK